MNNTLSLVTPLNAFISLKQERASHRPVFFYFVYAISYLQNISLTRPTEEHYSNLLNIIVISC